MILTLALTFAVLVQDGAPRKEPETRLRAFVVDVDGTLLVEGWRVTAHRNAQRDVAGGKTNALVDSATGVALFVDLPPGKYTVVAHGPLGVNAGGRNVELVGGAAADIELLYPSVDPMLQLTVALHGEGPSGARVGSTEGLVVEAVAADGARSTLAPRHKDAEVWCCNPRGTGPWRVLASSDCHSEVAVEGVRRGQITDVALVGNCALEITAVDAASGAPVERFDVEELGPGASSAVARVLTRATTPAEAPSAARFEGLVPGWNELVIRAPGFAPRLVVLMDSFAPLTTAELRIELVREFLVRGRVLDSDGSPLSGIAVSATRGREGLPPQAGAAPQFRRYGRVLGGGPDRSVISDAEGWFTFEGLWQTEHTFLADFGMGCTSKAIVSLPLPSPEPVGAAPGGASGLDRTESPRGVIVGAVDGTSVLELRCPPRAEIEVVIDRPRGTLGAYELWVERGDDPALRSAFELLAARDARVQIAADGSLVVKRYDAGGPRPVAPRAPKSGPRRPRGSEVPLEVDADGRLTATFLVLPGELVLHVAARAPGSEVGAAGGEVSQGGASGGLLKVESRTVEATLGAPVRVHLDLRE
jgi:hypothetical protein